MSLYEGLTHKPALPFTPLMLLAILLFAWPSISSWIKKSAAKKKTGGM